MGKPTKTKSSKQYDIAGKVHGAQNIGADPEGMEYIPGKLKRSSGTWIFKDYVKNMKYASATDDTVRNAHEETLHAGKNYENALHKFASYNTIFTLSGISEQELKEQSYFAKTPHDIIARTGGIGNPNITFKSANGHSYESQTEMLHRRTEAGFLTGETRNVGTDYDESLYFLRTGHDIFFENVNILSTTGPNSERGLANFQRMEFELHEPFGISLIEKVRAATFINGYLDYMDAPLLLTIEWKGWDEHGKEVKDASLKRRIPIRIVRVEFDVEAGGAKYTCIAVAAESIAFDDRFKFPRTQITIDRGYWPDWKAQIEKQMSEQMDDEMSEGVRARKDIYEFELSDEVREDAEMMGVPGGIWQTSNKQRSRGPGPKLGATIDSIDVMADSNTSLVKLMEDAVRSGFGYSKLVDGFWYEFGRILMNKGGDSVPVRFDKSSGTKVKNYLISQKFVTDLRKEKNQYVNWFTIKPKFEVLDGIDNIRKLQPKKITFVAVRTKIHILKFIKAGVSFGNVNWSDHVRKKYNYIYTGDNIDIQGLRIHYKTAYYMRNVRPFTKDEKEAGKIDTFKEMFEQNLNTVFGQEPYPEPYATIRQEPDIQRGVSTTDTADPRQYKNQEFYDYLTNPQVDMLRIELEILGDPAYVCQDQFTNLKGTSKRSDHNGPWNYRDGSFNSEAYQPLILLNYRLPEDFREQEGIYFQKKNRTMFFSGIYQVVKVDSRMDKGSFTQTLHCVRLNNQQGKGTGVKLGQKFTEYFKQEQEDADLLAAAEREKLRLEKIQENCFHPEQLVGDKFMKDLQPGDDINGKEILGMMKLRLTGDMYSISNVRVTGSHGIKYKNEWIFVADHPDSVKINDKPEFVYIPLVRTGTFTINNEEFADYDYHDMIVLGDEE